MASPTDILIVDDDDGIRQILQLVLQRAGFTTVSAANVQEAQAILNPETVQLIILDDMMPGITGSEWCAMLKSDETTRHIPVIMHSAYVRVSQPEYAARIGADEVLLKPCPPREIVRMVESYCASSAAS